MFGFPNTVKTENFHYKNNFLKSVIFQVKFDNQSTVLNKSKEIAEAFRKNYPNQNDVLENKIAFQFQNKTNVVRNLEAKVQGLNFSTKDGNKVVSINEESITYTVNGLNYINFENFYADIKEELNKIFHLCEITTLNRVAVRKINLLTFTIDANVKPVNALGLIFNNSLISSFINIPGSSLIEKSLSSLAFRERDFCLSLNYGLLPKDLQGKQNAVLDIDLFSIQSDIKVDSLEENLILINNEIFNIFSWALLDSTKNQLYNGN